MTTTIPQNTETRLRRRERRRTFITFFSIVLSIYGLINLYIFIRLKAAVPADSWFSPVFIGLFLMIAVSYFAGQYLESKYSTVLSDVLSWVGALWLGAMTWFFLAAVLIDFIRVLNHFLHFFPHTWYDDPMKVRE